MCLERCISCAGRAMLKKYNKQALSLWLRRRNEGARTCLASLSGLLRLVAAYWGGVKSRRATHGIAVQYPSEHNRLRARHSSNRAASSSTLAQGAIICRRELAG